MIRTLLLMIFLMFSISSWAVNLSAQQKLNYIKMATSSAKEDLQKGKIGQARLTLLAVMIPVQSLLSAAQQSPVKELFNDYMVARNIAWKGSEDLNQSNLKQFLSVIKQHKADLFRLSKRFSMDVMPSGRNQYYQKISDILAQRKAAYQLAAQVAMKSPPADQMIANAQVYQTLWGQQIPQMFYNITFGPAIAGIHAQKRVIPESIRQAKKNVQSASSSTDPATIYSKLARANTALQRVSLIENALKGEVDVSALTKGVVDLEKTIAHEKKRASELYEQQVDQNRMPSAVAWSNKSQQEKIIKRLKKAYQKRFATENVLKFILRSSDYGERWESWWEKNVFYSRYYGYVKVATAVQQDNGDYRVFIEWFRRDKQTNGTWGQPYYYKNITSYPIRKKNI